MATQTNFKALNCQVEYNTDGTPSGVVVIDGKRFTLGASVNLEALGSVPAQTGSFSGTAKILVARTIYVDSTPEPETVGKTATVEEQDTKYDSVTF